MKEVDIKYLNGDGLVVRQRVPVCSGSVYHQELMNGHYITLNFTLAELVNLQLYDEVECDYGRFLLTSLQTPTLNTSTGGYDYKVNFNAQYYAFGNFIMKYQPLLSHNETSFNLTANIATHTSILLDNIKAICANKVFRYNRAQDYEISLDSSVNTEKSVLISYDSVSVLDAFNAIADAFECEWWVDDNIIHFGKCELSGEPIDFVFGENIVGMTKSDSSKDYANRLYVFGSERNIPSNYRDVPTDSTIAGVVVKRLLLPKDKCPYGYIGETDDAKAIERVVTIDEVYPRNVIKVGNVSTYEDTVENEDGTTTTTTYYRLSNCKVLSEDSEGKEVEAGDVHFSQDYILETLNMRFESGALNGMDFECAFNPDGLAEMKGDDWNLAAQVFEVVANESYGRLLPDTSLYPKSGDKFILYGWDSTKMGDTGLVEAAEEELYQKGMKILADYNRDPSVYSCVQDPHNSLLTQYQLGTRVNLINSTFFENGRISRIIGLDIKLDIPYDNPTYSVGEESAYSRLNALEQSIEEVTAVVNYNISGGGGVHVISSNDTTPPSETNVFSAKRSLDRLKGGVVDGKVTFLGGVASDDVSSHKFVSGFDGEGWRAWLREGLARLEVDELVVRRTMNAFELLIHQVRSNGGTVIVSLADGKIKNVRKINDTSYEVTFEDVEGMGLLPNDYVRCQRWDYTNNRLKSYWVRIDRSGSVLTNSLVLVGDFSQGIPERGDELVLMGSTDTARQGAVMISAEEGGVPVVDVLSGISGTSLAGCLRARLGGLDGIVDDYFDEQPNGYGLYSDNAWLRGTFVLRNGEDVGTKFDILEDRVTSVVSGYVDSNLVVNPTFDGWDGWNVPTATIKMLANSGASLFLGNDLLSEGNSDGGARIEDGVMYLHGYTLHQTLDASLIDEGVEYAIEVVYKGSPAIELGHVAIADKHEDWATEIHPIQLDEGSNELTIQVGQSDEAWVRSVRVLYKTESKIEQTADAIKLALGETGIDIEKGEITLNADKTRINGDLLAGSLNTIPLSGSNARIEASGNTMRVYGSNGVPNWVWTIDENTGFPMLSCYDSNGTFLYDLGPRGIGSIKATEDKYTAVDYYAYSGHDSISGNVTKLYLFEAATAGGSPIGENADKDNKWYTTNDGAFNAASGAFTRNEKTYYSAMPYKYCVFGEDGALDKAASIANFKRQTGCYVQISVEPTEGTDVVYFDDDLTFSKAIVCLVYYAFNNGVRSMSNEWYIN